MLSTKTPTTTSTTAMPSATPAQRPQLQSRRKPSLWAWGSIRTSLGTAEQPQPRRSRRAEFKADPILYILSTLAMTDSLLVYLNMQGPSGPASSIFSIAVLCLLLPFILAGIGLLLLLRLAALLVLRARVSALVLFATVIGATLPLLVPLRF